MLSALDYLHSTLHMLHRDIKPANILLNTKVIFSPPPHSRAKSNSPTLGSAATSTRQGQFAAPGQAPRPSCPYPTPWVCPSFTHPERIAGEPYDSSSDVWPLGVTLFMAATGNYPFAANYREVPAGVSSRGGGLLGALLLHQE